MVYHADDEPKLPSCISLFTKFAQTPKRPGEIRIAQMCEKGEIYQ